MEKRISYLDRTYSDYRQSLIDLSKKYYPDLAINYNDASIGSWLIDLHADIADNLSYHIDRVYQETNIESAKERSSLYNLARNNGMKIPGPKGSMTEVRFSLMLPVMNSAPDWNYAPVVKRGTKISSATQQFEVLEDIDFTKQFNEDGYSDRTIIPAYNSNGIITAYTVTKLSVATAGSSTVYKQAVMAKDIKPFMEIVIPVQDIMNVESIVEVEGSDVNTTPNYGAFYSELEKYCPDGKKKIYRYFEVDNLAQTEIWAPAVSETNGQPQTYEYGYETKDGTIIPTYSVTAGTWKPIKHKFITEYTDKGYLKVIFGAGNTDVDKTANYTEGASTFAKHRIAKMLNNDNMGVLPNPNSTIFILYRTGGGVASNVAKGAINKITRLNIELNTDGTDSTTQAAVRNSIKVTNTIPSISGKDMPTVEELKYMIKYHNAAQERCVTVKDYLDRILLLPPKYGTPFRVGAMEENNKIMLYLLGIDYQGKLDTSLPSMLIKNMTEYLSAYRMINDYVEIKSGRIINLMFDADIIIDKTYNKSDVSKTVIETIKNYMDINKHNMGEEIYIGDLEKEISKVDGVINLIELRVYNAKANGYSSTPIGQETKTVSSDCDTKDMSYAIKGQDIELIDLDATDGILYSEGDQMYEIKYPEKDITVRIKSR